MNADSPSTVTGHVELSGTGWRCRAELTVSTGPTRLTQMVPLMQVLADNLLDVSKQQVQKQGQTISCKAGCAACCRQLVLLSETEARYLNQVVQALPEPRQSEVRARFAELRRRLEQTGLFDRLLRHAQWAPDETRAFSRDYFEQHLACPFLEDESCSIYAERPIGCRDYLVTSPAENCSNPTPETVRVVPKLLPSKLWTALARFEESSSTSGALPWVPLPLALEWAETHFEEPPSRPGTEQVRRLIEQLTGNKLALAEG